MSVSFEELIDGLPTVFKKAQALFRRLRSGDTDQTLTVKTLTVDKIKFNTAAVETVAQGEMAWNADEETTDTGLNGATLQAGQEIMYHSRNNTASAIGDAVPLMATGTLGNSGRITIAPMDGSDKANAMYIMGISTEDIPVDDDGKVTQFGKVRNVDTTGTPYGEVWNDGDIIWVDPVTPGALTNVEPALNLMGIPCAIVIHAHTNGTLFTRTLPFDLHVAEASIISFDTYSAIPARNAEENVHGGLVSIVTGHNLSAGALTLTGATAAGLGKLVIVVNAGTDVVGTITVTGTQVDRDTGAETAAQTDTLTIDALTTDASTVDANGEDRHSLTGAYITSHWYDGSAENVVISSSDTTITDIDVYGCSFEQLNDAPKIILNAFDANFLCTDATGAAVSIYLYTVVVTNGKVTIVPVAEFVRSTFVASRYYRIRRAKLDIPLNGTKDGIFLTSAFLGAPSKFADAGLKIWLEASRV